MKYLTKFVNHTAYQTYVNYSDYVTPNISLCASEKEIHFNPLETRVVITYNVTDTSEATQLCYSNSVSQFSDIEIDGVAQQNVVSSYTFSTTGIHIVRFTLVNSRSIGSEAFSDCSNIISVTIPNGVEYIDEWAFVGCTSLTNVNIPDSIGVICKGAFEYCSGLTSIDIPDSVYKILNAVFYECTSLQSIVIPNHVTSISDSTFEGCSALTSVYIPSSVTSIGNDAFGNCTSLTNIDIPDDVTSIGNGAFNCCTSITSINIPNSVTSINDWVFSSCSGLISITIPDSVTSIGMQAFDGCIALTSINIPSSVISIDGDAFSSCIFTEQNFTNNSSLDAEENDYWGAIIVDSKDDGILIKDGILLRYIGNETSITIPNGVTSIGEGAFYDCTGLTSVTIPNSITSIGGGAFEGCSNIISIISNATTAPNIESNTFQDINSGGTLTVPIGSTGYDVWMGTDDDYLGNYGWTKVEQ